MNKAAIKNFAVWARRKLISEITYKAGLLGVTENGAAEPLPQSTRDLQFFDIGTKNYAEVKGAEIAQRSALVAAIKEKAREVDDKTAFQNIVEEVAYTWFNRMIAIRFMEINDYLPSRIRVLSSENPSKLEPDFVTTPFDTDLDFTPDERDRVLQLKDENKLDELFRALFIKQCNKLHEILPELFEETSDYTELLLTISFTDKDGVVYHLTHDIPESDFDISHTDEDGKTPGQVEIIGWMYQYYNTEPKDEVFALLKKNVKITKERIPAATQLFTPDWIVRYMIENSLGRLWVEGHPNDTLKAGWKYYLEEAEQEPEVQAQLAEIRKDYAKLTPEEIKIIDPCMGSGHILVYAFDVLMQIYEAQGYTQRDAARLIVEKNLYGLDIDKRAYQLAYFAVMMKARQYNRRILNGEVKPNLYAIDDSAAMKSGVLDFIANGNQKMRADLQSIADDLTDAKEYGSIIHVAPVDFDALFARFEEIRGSYYDDIFDGANQQSALNTVLPLVKQAQAMAQKYNVVVTNPPYMAVSNAGVKVNDYVKKNFPDSKADMFAVFIERCGQMAKKNGYQAMITQHAWMFIASYEKLREKLLARTVSTMLHFGARAFDEIAGEVVQTVAFIITNDFLENYRGTYFRLLNGNSEKEKEKSFFAKQDVYIACQKVFKAIPRTEYIYWVSPALLKAFATYKQVRDFYTVRNGLTTGDNNTFLRLWYEVSEQTMSYKWFPCNKGGSFRRWYGNRDYLINWENDGIALKNFKDEKTGKLRSTLRNIEYNFLPAIVVGHVVSGDLPFRYVDSGFISESAVNAILPINEHGRLLFLLAVLNSKPCNYISAMLSPTLGVSPEDVLNIPIPTMNPEDVEHVVEKNIATSKEDWDSYETSWDFKRNPLV